MRIDWRAVVRDALGVLVVSGIGLLVFRWLVSDASAASQGASAVVLMIVGFCISGCLAKQARFKHLAIVATIVWLLGALLQIVVLNALILENIALNIAVLWSLLAIGPVFACMLLGGLASLAIVRSPPASGSPQP